MKAKSIKTVEVKEIGTINLNKIEAVSGQFEVFIPILHVNQEMDDLMEKLYKDFRSKHPEVDEKDICVDTTVRYSIIIQVLTPISFLIFISGRIQTRMS